MKDNLVRAKAVFLGKNKDAAVDQANKSCEICQHLVTTETFRSFSTQGEYSIKRNNLNCDSSKIVYLLPCKACSKQYTGSTVL